MSSNIRLAVIKVSRKASDRASKIVKSVFASKPKDKDEEYDLVVPSSSAYSQSSGSSRKATAETSYENIASLLRDQQDVLWEEEDTERTQDLTTHRLLHISGMKAKMSRLHRRDTIRANLDNDVIDNTPPLPSVAKSQPATLRTVSDTSDSSHPPAMWEQQTGIIREVDVKLDSEVDPRTESGSDSSSLRRRGAVRHKANPVSARLTYEEVKQFVRAD